MVDFIELRRTSGLDDKLRRISLKETQATSKYSNRKARAIRKLEKQRTAELESIEEDYRARRAQINSEFDSKSRDKKSELDALRMQEENEYYRKASFMLFNQLAQDYELMQDRSDILGIPVGDLQKARKVATRLSEISDEVERAKMLDLVADLENEGVRNAANVLSREHSGNRGITSYVAAKPGECYIVVPVNGNENKLLSDNLNTKIMDIVTQGKIVLGGESTARDGVIENSNMHSISFDVKDKLINGFRVYTLTFNNGSPEGLEIALKQKLEQLQPENFDAIKLRHNVQIIEIPLLEYFVKTKPEEMHLPKDCLEELANAGTKHVSIEETAKILRTPEHVVKRFISMGKLQYEDSGVAIDSIQNYLDSKTKIIAQKVPRTRTRTGSLPFNYTFDSQTPDERKQEAYNRLDEIDDDNLDTKQVMHILGLRSNMGALLALKKLPTHKEGRSVYVDKTALRGYIEERNPANRGWRIGR